MTESSSPIARPVALDRGNVLRIRNGRGTRVHAASGVLWITEENSPDDHVLLPGDAINLARTGTAIVLAHRPARVVVEVPTGIKPPRAVEVVLRDGEPGTRVALAAAATMSLPVIVAKVVARAIARIIATIRAMVRRRSGQAPDDDPAPGDVRIRRLDARGDRHVSTDQCIE